MKKRLILIISIVLIILVSVVIYIKINGSRSNNGQETISDDITTLPTQSPTPTEIPEPTTPPATAADNALFLIYQRVDNVRKYGYMNTEGVIVIPPEFDEASEFRDGVAVVYLNNQYCAINQKGEVIYTSNGVLKNFSNGMAVISEEVGNDILYGYIDTNGEVVIQPQFQRAYNFTSNDTAYVYQGKGVYSLIDKTGTILENYTLADQYDNPWDFYDGYIIYTEKDTYKYGVVDLKGNSVFDPIYSEITYLGEGIFAMKEPSLDFFLDQLMIAPAALFNYEGRQLTDYSLYDLSEFHDGYASATDETSTFFIDTTGKKVMELPTFEGRGSLTLYGDYIRAEIDNDLFYCMKNGDYIWKQDYDVHLTEELTVKRNKFKANRYILVYYPQVEGLKDKAVMDSINEELRSIFVDAYSIIAEENANLSVDDRFNASLLGNLLVIEKLGYDYFFGAVHGMPIMDYYYIDIRTGQFYQFKDLFLEGSDYAGKINELIRSEIAIRMESEDALFFTDQFEGISEAPNFMLSEDAITIYFYPYEIAAYAAGFPEFDIPFADIEDFLNKDGNFWLAFH